MATISTLAVITLDVQFVKAGIICDPHASNCVPQKEEKLCHSDL
jgi:hypothetical protein